MLILFGNLNIISEEGLTKKIEVLEGMMGCGKALRNDAKLYTKDGFITIGDCAVGDLIYGEDGKLHEIVGKYPQGLKKLYKVVFSDGNEVICCADHLWTYQHPQDVKVGRFRTSSLKEIMSKDLFKQTGKCKNWQFFIPVTKPVNFNKVDLKINPYLMGLLLGDGSFLHNVSFTNSEVDICEKFESKVDSFRKYKSRNTFEYRIKKSSELFGNLKSLCLVGLKSEHKFIPNDYKYGSIEDRFALLKGLLDTDGYSTGNAFEYSSASKQLALDVKEVAESLGCVVTMSKKDITTYEHNGEILNGLPSYRLRITCSDLRMICSSDKHLSKINTVCQRKPNRTIRDIVYIGNDDCTCIEVSNPTKLFLTDGFIPTHNTTKMLEWIDNNPNEKYFYVSPNLSEVDVDGRIHNGVERVEFVSPSVDEHGTKIEHLNELLVQGKNIACTHKLYLSMDNFSMELIRDRGYTVILDEEINVIQSYDQYSFSDIKWLIQQGYISVDETDGSVTWLKEDDLLNSTDHRYFYCKNLCDKKSLYLTRFDISSEKAKKVMMVTQVPIKLLECAKRVVVITYLFKGSVLDRFLTLKGFEVEKFNDVRLESVKPSSFKDLLTIIPPDRFIEDYAMTSRWWHKEVTAESIKKVNNFLLRNARRYANDCTDVLWTCPKERAKGVSRSKGFLVNPIGYVNSPDLNGGKKSNWLSVHTRATNDYANKRVLMHCYNRFPLVDVASYLQDYGYPIDNNVFAVSELVQWLWRGCIRKGEPMVVVMGNKRMYNLLMRWLNDEFEGE